MSDNKLVLHPVDPWAILQDPPQLMESLRKAGLVGGGFSHVGELHYRAGPRFAELVSFPAGAPAGEAACHLSVLETTPSPTFLGAVNAQPPSCPQCAKRIPDWRAQLLEWQKAPQRYLWSCPGCGKKMRLPELVWDDTGGVARYSLDVWNVAHGEAVPSPELLALLEQETFQSFRYFYYRF